MKQDTPISVEQPVAVQKLLDALPGLIGAIDNAIRSETGTPQPFVLLVFSGNGALHATNFDHKAAMAAVLAFAGEVANADTAEGAGDATH